MCGILATLLADPDAFASLEILEGLNLLQHRGQDAAGIVTCGQKGRLYQFKGNGMVKDLFQEGGQLYNLVGNMGVGHVRYPTAGSAAQGEAQPFYVNSPYGITFAHNGNLINTPHLRYFMDHYAHRHINTDSDSELILNMLADALQKTGKYRIDEDDVFRAVAEVIRQAQGAYACVLMIAGFGIIAFRDPNGIRPLGFATRKSTTANGWDYLVASESVVAEAQGYSDWTDVKPGECIIITRSNSGSTSNTPQTNGHGRLTNGHTNGTSSRPSSSSSSASAAPKAVTAAGPQVSRRQVVPVRTYTPDIFEYVYFARPDSVMDGISVYRARMAMGDMLAGEVKRVLSQARFADQRGGAEPGSPVADSPTVASANALDLGIDVVIPVPDTSRVAALQCAQKLGIPYREGFVKNRYVGRTFIMPGQQMRRKNVRRKLNAMALEFNGKNVLIVDDSIVRGTTSKEIVQMARDVGAKRVVVASCAPPIRHVNVYGIDMPSRQELVAHGRTEEEVAKAIGADRVIFQTLDDLVESCRSINPAIEDFECSVFSGEYVTGGVDEGYLQGIENLRGENAKLKKSLERGAANEVGGASAMGGNGAGGEATGSEGGLAASQHSGGKLPTAAVGCSGPMNGADDNIGLHNEGWGSRSQMNNDVAMGNSHQTDLSVEDRARGSSWERRSRERES